ncbi:MAG: hypothetical protein P4L84_11025 [Isosphaeraceae bacterium]|nr:hypothetical protein [Isosphaeraceae bacterium]
MSWEWVLFAVCAFLCVLAIGAVILAGVGLVVKLLFFRRPKGSAVPTPSPFGSITERLEEEQAAYAKQFDRGMNAVAAYLRNEQERQGRMKAILAGSTSPNA